MALSNLSNNVISNFLSFFDKKNLFEFGNVSQNTKKILRIYVENISGISALEGKEISASVLSQRKYSQDELDFYANYLRENQDVQSILIRIVKATKDIVQIAKIGANAILILNHYGYDFNYQDFSWVNLPFANFFAAKLIGTDFSNANIKGANFNKACLEDTVFSNSTKYKKRKKTNKKIKVALTINSRRRFVNFRTVEKQTLYIKSSVVNCAAISDDEKIFAFGINKSIRLYKEDFEYFFVAHEGEVSALSLFKSNFFLVSGDNYQIIKIWNIEKDYCLFHTLIGHTSSITCLSVSPNDELIASGSKDKNVKVWNKKIRKFICSGHLDTVSGVTWNSTGNLVISVSKDKTLRIWNTDGYCVNLFYNKFAFSFVNVTKNNEIVTGDCVGCIKLWTFEGKVNWFYNSKLLKIKNIRFPSSANLIFIHGKLGIEIQHISAQSFKESYGKISSVYFDKIYEFIFIGFSSGMIQKFSVFEKIVKKTYQCENQIEFLGLISNDNLIASEKYKIYFFDFELNLIKTFEEGDHQIKDISVFLDILTITYQLNNSIIVKGIDLKTENIILKTEFVIDLIKLIIYDNIIIYIDRRFVYFVYSKLQKKKNYLCQNALSAFFDFPFLFVNENNEILYIYDIPNDGLPQELKMENTSDAKFIHDSKQYLIVNHERINLFDSKLNLLHSISSKPNTKLFYSGLKIFCWCQNYIFSIEIKNSSNNVSFSQKKIVLITV